MEIIKAFEVEVGRGRSLCLGSSSMDTGIREVVIVYSLIMVGCTTGVSSFRLGGVRFRSGS